MWALCPPWKWSQYPPSTKGQAQSTSAQFTYHAPTPVFKGGAIIGLVAVFMA